MVRYVVFLRAINVGGHTVTKENLQKAFTSFGFHDLVFYKQSGNVIFETDTSNPEAVKMQIESKLTKELGFEVNAFVRTISQLKQLLALNPFKTIKEEEVDFQVTFLSLMPEDVSLKLPLRIPNSTADILSVCGTEVFSVTRRQGDGGKPNPFLESHLNVKATTRNWRVVKSIAELYAEIE